MLPIGSNIVEVMHNLNLFDSVVPKNKIHPAFKALRDSNDHQYAKGLMNSLFARMTDPNGNFVRDFQSDGFHSRVFELACFAYLEEAGLSINRQYERPDFVATRDNISICVEVTSANPSTGRKTDIALNRMLPLSEDQIQEKVNNEFPKRMRSVLRKKSRRRYERLSHCEGKPIVLMVAPFFEAGSVFYVDEALLRCLYDYGEVSEEQQKIAPLFTSKENDSISAVLYCNAFTVPRFFRLSTPLGENSELVAIRQGYYLEDSSESMFSVSEFRYRVGDDFVPRETWAEGVTVFLNPYARIPLDPLILPCTSRFSVRDDYLIRDIIGFHPVLSSMIVGRNN